MDGISRELVRIAREVGAGYGLGTRDGHSFRRTISASRGRDFIEVEVSYKQAHPEGLVLHEVAADFKELGVFMNKFVKKWGGNTYETTKISGPRVSSSGAVGTILIGMKMTPDEMVKFIKQELEE